MSIASDLFSKVMELPEAQRAELAHRLLLSLEEDPPDPDAEAVWRAELEQRASSLDQEQLQSTPWREALDRMRRNLKTRG